MVFTKCHFFIIDTLYNTGIPPWILNDSEEDESLYSIFADIVAT